MVTNFVSTLARCRESGPRKWIPHESLGKFPTSDVDIVEHASWQSKVKAEINMAKRSVEESQRKRHSTGERISPDFFATLTAHPTKIYGVLAAEMAEKEVAT